jgi:predicted Ser/Thr protein kinase
MCPAAETLVQFVAGSLDEATALGVETHLDACGGCRASTSALVRGEVAEPRFGRYRLDTVLGSGGMGIVYRAWDPQLARAVAIKVVRRSEDAEHRARLVREAQSLARLSHAHVCHVYDVGTDDDEVWLAMELIDGATLRAWASERRPDEIVTALRGAALGLAAAHQAGLVHRDVKPENVLVDRAGRAVVTDFGLARVDAGPVVPDASTVASEPELTATGAVAGTPAYLAPEQLTGAAVDARADQFAWATMAWELLTGVRPFPADPGVRLAAIRAGLTAPRELPPRLAAALVRALALRPSDRFASLTELLATLDAPPPRRRAPVIVAVGALAIVGVGTWRLAASREAAPRPPMTPTAIAPSPAIAAPPADAALAIASPAATAPITAPITAPLTAPIAATPRDAGVHPRDAGQAVTASPPPTVAPTAAPPKPTQLAELALHDPRIPRVTPAELAPFLDDCILPVDPRHPDPLQHGAADWGPITRKEVIEIDSPVVGQGRIALLLYELRGARATYHVEGRLGASARNALYDLALGQLVIRCPDTSHPEDNTLYKLPPSWPGPMQYTGLLLAVRHPPRIATDLAPRNLLHLTASQLTKALPDDRTILVAATPSKQVDALWDMGGWSLDPADLGHADRLVAGRQVWLIVDQPRDLEVGTKRRRVLHGVDVLTAAEIFD